MLLKLSAKNRNGQSIAEYALALALVTLAVVTVITSTGQNLSTKYVGINQSITGDTPGCPGGGCGGDGD